MSLGKKTLALFLMLGCAICLGSYLALRLTVLPAFADFERQSSVEALKRVTRMMDADLRALEIMNLEYSAWDDTYEYASGSLPEFEADNLDPAYWHSIDINMMMIFDTQGKPLFARIGDARDGHELQLAKELLFDLDSLNPLITHGAVSDSVLGLLVTRSGILQVVSYPILTSEREGPIAGSLIVGQFLTEQRLLDLGERATVNVTMSTFAEPGAREKADRNFPATDSDTIVIVSEDYVRGSEVLNDVFGNPAIVLEVTQPRKISAIGDNTIRTAMTFLAFGSIGFLVAALSFIQHLIVKPIRVLTDKILNIRETGNLEIDVGRNRSDEIGVLATKFGELTSNLGHARKQLEDARDDALSLSAAKSEFLARMSHEIRTPMNGVLGMTELLRNTSLTDKQERFARTINESAEALLHIINDILDISKIEAGKLELDVAPFNLRNVIEECLDLLADSAHRKGLELVAVIPPDVNTGVEGDALRLRQVLVNLLSNAVKFTEQGEIVVRVNEIDLNDEQVTYRIEVEDTGIGVDPRNVATIFEPFTQEDGSTTRRFGGTGLGLSICKQLIDLMHGEIGVESRPGMGCKFWIEVALARNAALQQSPTPESLSGRRVLIVDDNATNRETLREQLENWRMRVTSASSGAEAIGILSTSLRNNVPFETVLLDMNMPEMDGVELANEIRQTSGYDAAPLIMLSSVAVSDTGDRRDDSALDAWLTKPVRQERLCDVLVSHLGRDKASTNSPTKTRVPADATNDNEIRSLRILLAEDNEVNKVVATSMLDDLGHQAVVVSNGAEAVKAFENERFDVVIMDCQMPVVDGLEATKSIRRWESKQGREPSPIIALTAKALDGDRDVCLDAGMNDYMSKPFTLEQLANVLARNVVAARELTREQGTSRARILVVDDNSINQQVTEALLHDLGYSCDVAADGDEALRAIAAKKYDLVFMDCHMPVRNGYETSREIRRAEQASASGSHLPVIALTADLMQNNRERCLDAGMDDYVPKPFTQEQLRRVIARWLPDGSAEAAGNDVTIDEVGFTEMTDSISISSLDRGALDEILQLDSSSNRNVAREILLSFCALSTRLVLQLRSSVADADFDQTELIAHSLKGCSGQIGALILAELCEKILDALRHDDLSDTKTLCERVAIEHSAVLIALDNEVQRIAA